MGLRELPTTPSFTTSTTKLAADFYGPCLRRSISFSRGVGYFTSAWLRMVSGGLAELATNGGKARILTSPKLSAEDWAALVQGTEAREDRGLRASLEKTLAELSEGLYRDTLTTMAWMVADGLLEFRLAIPANDLDGDYHDKIGVFADTGGDRVAFHGSPNDSEKAFRNYESISVFYSWVDAREAARVQEKEDQFEKLWSNRDPNLRVFELPEAVKRNLVEITARTERPYPAPSKQKARQASRWDHQRDAMAAFLQKKNGVLEMATGTGKTRTALSILNELHARAQISTAVITASGTDLLEQWHLELTRHAEPFAVYRMYEQYKEAQSFLNHPRDSVLLISRHFLCELLPRFPRSLRDAAMLICDEVHGMGAESVVNKLQGELRTFPYRLGLSATPERAYDVEGNRFVEDEIGPVIFRFGLDEAIRKGILCELDYIDLEYTFSQDDRDALRAAHARYHARVNAGEAPPVESLYQDLARIRKLSKEKLPIFREYVKRQPDVLKRSLIFVETREYGMEVQDILMKFARTLDYHTYYGDDERSNLQRFAKGELDCLVTCHKISEGIDIRSVSGIVLFSSARSRLETIQRLGRCLRVDPSNPDKRATVVDFIEVSDSPGEGTGEAGETDSDRRDWFRQLAQTRRGS